MFINNSNNAYDKWSRLVNAGNDIKDENIKRTLAIVLENTQTAVDNNARNHGRSLLLERFCQR